ncbi:MAG TPA: peptidylprolyl isomerase [Thermoanaerobaculaceae bacterium]|nr:peptidylprolyl isomerase [Thermoanaerobaculaceae bacterium]
MRKEAIPMALMLVLTACRQPTSTLALVKGRPVPLDDLKASVESQTGRPFAEASPALVASLFEGLLEEEVLLAAVGVEGSRDLTPAARSAKVREAALRLCPPPPLPSDAEVEAFLARDTSAAPTGTRIRLRQLVLPDQASARAARERLRKGDDFTDVSREVSRAPNASQGGLLGWVGTGQLPPEFEAAVFGLAAGELSEPVPSTAGWHVFQVTDRRAAGSGTDPAWRERARAELAAQRAETARRTCVRGLASQVGVEVRCTNAPFPCRNPFEV